MVVNTAVGDGIMDYSLNGIPEDIIAVIERRANHEYILHQFIEGIISLAD